MIKKTKKKSVAKTKGPRIKVLDLIVEPDRSIVNVLCSFGFPGYQFVGCERRKTKARAVYLRFGATMTRDEYKEALKKPHKNAI